MWGGFFGGDHLSGAYDFKNCDITNLDITVKGDAKVYAGGFGGSARGGNCWGDINTCKTQGTITNNNTNTESYFGGFYANGDGGGRKYNNCVADVDITSTLGTAGGFIGNSNETWHELMQEYNNCEAKGDVSGNVAGGFIGTASRADINNCTASGDVTGTVAGGLIGKFKPQGRGVSVADTTATGTVTGSDIASGFIGDATDTTGATIEFESGCTPSSNVNGTSEATKVVSLIYANEGDTNILYPVASIGDVEYTSLEAAIAEANDGDTIILSADAVISGGVDMMKNITIDAQEKKLTFKATGIGTQTEFGAFNILSDFAIKNATLAIDNQLGSAAASAFVIGAPGKLTLENVTMNVNGFANGSVFYNDGEIIVNNCDITIKNTKGAFMGEGKSPLSITDSEVVLDNAGFGIYGQDATVKNSTLDAKNFPTFANSSDLTVDNSEVTISDITYHGFSSGKITVTNNSNMTISNCGRNGMYLLGGDNSVSNNSTLTVKDCGEREIRLIGDGAAITKDDTSKIVATIERTNPVDLTGDVTVTYEDVTVNEGEKVYNIYVEADNKTINRLTSAEFKFEVRPEDDAAISYAVSGTKKVNVTPDSEVDGSYLFNFNGVDAADITGKKINLGQIKFTGYGKFDFAITYGEAHATTAVDNIVTDYVAEPDPDNDKQAKLTYGVLEDIEIKEATRKLTINITFPNAVKDNAKAYQDMKVTIKGGEYDKTFALGNDDNAMVEGAYKLEADLVKDTPYTVTVSGAGYRTAYYTVTMNADKTLNFWNNAKDTAMEVEEDKAASAKKVTFLAGDLVNDGKINIYDLSAVVSYFGTDNLVTEHPEYAKYDLNRDGKIDSKDVAYVLVSWGK